MSLTGLLRERLEWWTSERMRRPRIIHNREGTDNYLSRFYLRGAPRMPDGSEPFDEHGDPRPGIIESELRHPHVYLHRFHRSDADGELHNHPWQWAIAIVLVGGYSEERRDPGGGVYRRLVTPGTINFIRHNDFHRVDLLEHDAWSLFITGPRVQDWGFWSRVTKEYTPWREFINRVRDPYSFMRVQKGRPS